MKLHTNSSISSQFENEETKSENCISLFFRTKTKKKTRHFMSTSSSSLSSNVEAIDFAVIVLQSSIDNARFEVFLPYALPAQLIRVACEGEPSVKNLPLCIPGHILAYIVSFMNNYRGNIPDPIPKPLPYKELSRCTSDLFAVSFIETVASHRQELFDLIMAANYLDYSPLMMLGCAKVCSLLKHEHPRDFHRILAYGSRGNISKAEDLLKKAEQDLKLQKESTSCNVLFEES